MRNGGASGTERPSLDAIAANPESVRGLSRDSLFSLALQAQAVQLACTMAMIEANGEQPPAPTVDDVLDLPSAAQRLGMAPETLASRAKRPPYNALRIDNGTRRLRFSSARIEAFKAGSSPRVPAGPNGEGKSATSPRHPAPYPRALAYRRGRS